MALSDTEKEFFNKMVDYISMISYGTGVFIFGAFAIFSLLMLYFSWYFILPAITFLTLEFISGLKVHKIQKKQKGGKRT